MQQATSRLSESDAIEPALEIAIVLRRIAQSLFERVVQPVERALAIERRGDERAIDLREGAVVELAPTLLGDLGHA
jgi:hypothetical protein